MALSPRSQRRPERENAYAGADYLFAGRPVVAPRSGRHAAIARDLAEALGGQTAEDAIDLHPARPRGKLPTPRFPDGRPLPVDARAIMLLVLDPTGRPIRGHILEAEPPEIGPVLLAGALTHSYEPRLLLNEPIASNVILAFHRGPRNATPTTTPPP